MSGMHSYDRHIILAVDPGKATGWATLEPGMNFAFNSGEVEGGALGFGSWVASALNTDHVLWEVVCEKFTVGEMTKGKTKQYDALYLNGFLEVYCHLLGVQFTRHLVSNVKKFAPNSKLKKLGWYRGGAGHADDAARHMLAYISKLPWAQPLMGELL